MTTAFQLLINGIDATPPGASVDDSAEWDVKWEERIDGVGVASGTVQDRNNSQVFGQERDEIEMLVNGVRVFHGEITRSRLELPPGRPWRRWKFTASDFNTVLDLRLVGVPDGRHFVSKDGGTEGPPPTGTWDPIDLDAHSLETDKLTIAALFDAYAALPDASTFDASTFVKSYINKWILLDDAGEPAIHWLHTTLRSALNELAAMGGFPIYFWIDPDDAFHWINFRDFALGATRPSLGPRHAAESAGPAIVTDSSPDHSSTIGGRDLFYEYDGTYMPEQVYVVGVTDYIFNGPHDVTLQGTGFEKHDIRDTSKRQILVDAESMTQGQKDATAKSYLQFNTRARIKGSVTIGQPAEAIDGWRCGDLLTVIDARSPLSGESFPIQRVGGSLKAGNDFREYVLEFGDAPIGRFGAKYNTGAQRLPTARLPAKEHEIQFPTVHLRPSTEYTLVSQMKDRSGKPFRQGGVPVQWNLRVLDGAGAIVGTGTLVVLDPIVDDPNTATTDVHGRTAAVLTTGAGTALHYHPHAFTEAQGVA